MRKTIIGAVLALLSVGAHSAEWQLRDEVETPPNAAMLCHFWGVTFFAPGETPSCRIGTLFTVDLEARVLRYENATEQGLPRNLAARNLQRSVLGSALQGEGFEKLESMRSALLAELEEARVIAETNNAQSEYWAAYKSATSLERIQAFQEKYAANDPDELIPQLAAIKKYLTLERYRAAYGNAKSSADLRKFVEEYRGFDPENLVTEALKRIPQVEKQESLVQQKTELKRQEELRQQERTAKQEAAEQARNRLKYIKKLHSMYAGNITSESPEAFKIVSRFNINCGHPDGRVLPLLHALYASMAQMEGLGGRMVFYFQNRGQAVRIFSEVFKNGKPLGERSLYYQLNEWGDLRPVAVRSEAVLNACVGSQGPIWLMPGEPGY